MFTTAGYLWFNRGYNKWVIGCIMFEILIILKSHSVSRGSNRYRWNKCIVVLTVYKTKLMIIVGSFWLGYSTYDYSSIYFENEPRKKCKASWHLYNTLHSTSASDLLTSGRCLQMEAAEVALLYFNSLHVVSHKWYNPTWYHMSTSGYSNHNKLW